MSAHTANAARRPSAVAVSRSSANRPVANPLAAPRPRIHHAVIPAYAWVVESNPPFAYESANTAPATPRPTAMFLTPADGYRNSLFLEAMMSYSTAHVARISLACGSWRSRCSCPRRADCGLRVWRILSREYLYRVPTFGQGRLPLDRREARQALASRAVDGTADLGRAPVLHTAEGAGEGVAQDEARARALG